MPFLHCLGRAKESIQVRGALKHFVTIKKFYGEGLSVPRPTTKLEGNPLLAVRDCLFNIFAATLRTRRTSLHPQPEERMRGAVPPLPQYAFMAWCIVKAQGRQLHRFLHFPNESYFTNFVHWLRHGMGDKHLDYWRGQWRDFPLHHQVQSGSGAHPASCPMGTGGSFLGGKATGGVKLTVHFHLVPRLRTRGAVISTPPVCLNE
jgi:hypothetical protein